MVTVRRSAPVTSFFHASAGTGSPKASNMEYNIAASSLGFGRSLTVFHQADSLVVFHSAASDDPIRRTIGIN